MLRKNRLLCLILTILLVLGTVGCSFVPPNEGEPGTDAVTEPITEPITELVTEPVTEPALPDNFAEIYHEAEAVYAMFTKHRADIYFNGTTYVDGIRYRVVNIKAIMSFEKLSAYCKQYFDAELTDKLISTTVGNNYPLFSVIDGWLYRVDNYWASFDYDVGHDYTMTLERVENGVYTVRVEASMTDNSRDISATAFCTYTLSEDGEIRFTSFELMAEKFYEILLQIPVDPEPTEPFDPERFAELIPASTAHRLFWHRITDTENYLYFCAIRKIDSTMTSYTDDPPKDFVIYAVSSIDRQIRTVKNIHEQLPEELKYDTVCPVVAIAGSEPLRCKFILQMTEGDRVFYVAFDNYDYLQPQYHLTFTYRGILSDEEVNALKETYPVSFEKARKYYMGIPREQYCFEYGGAEYDLSKIYSEVNGVSEWGHIGKYVVAEGHINPGDSLYVLINTETQRIAHHFVGSLLTYHSDLTYHGEDIINTIVYGRGNQVRSLDGTLFADLELDAGEYLLSLAYTPDKTQLVVTIGSQESTRTTTIDRFPGITQNTFNLGFESKLDYVIPVAVYGEIHPYVNPDRYAPSVQTNEYSPDGMGYVTFGIANDMRAPNVCSRYYTYRITQKGGYIASIEEAETITKEIVLRNGKPYSGNLDGQYTGIAYNHVRTVTVSGDEISVSSYLSGTDAGGTYIGTYIYDPASGSFWAELAFQYHDNGTLVTNPVQPISGKLYEYGGFIHFVCRSSNISTLDVNEELPITLTRID